MHLVDIAAAMAASRHSNSYVVTASVDYIDFRNPINIGEIVILKSQVNRVFHTSMEIGVKVFSENALTGERKHTTTAYVTFVAIDAVTREPQTGRSADSEDRRRKTALARSGCNAAKRGSPCATRKAAAKTSACNSCNAVYWCHRASCQLSRVAYFPRLHQPRSALWSAEDFRRRALR